MAKKKTYITVTDQFCGAGGSSQGVKLFAESVGGGVELSVALNHWKLAIETHNTNFPDAYHDCTDISACDPRRYPSTDILITSPECTNHSLAKGVKIAKKQIDIFNTGRLDPAAERSRATMWDVPRFAEYHNYNAIIVENVVDARKWIMYDAWLQAMYLLGYLHKCVYANSMHFHPTPQSRDRMYIVFWKKGNKAPSLDHTPIAYFHSCKVYVNAVQSWKKDQKSFKYKTGYIFCCPLCSAIVEPYYYAAFNCIDWSDLGTRIGERKNPLKPNTIKRIEYGLKKYGNDPQIIVNYSPGYAKHINDACATVTSNDHCALLNPFIINDQQSTGIDFRTKSINGVVPTIASKHQLKLVTPFIIQGDQTHAAHNRKLRSVDQALQTHTTRQIMGLVMPFIPVARGKSMSHSSSEPLSTQSQMINHGVVSNDQWRSFISSYYGSMQASGIHEAVNTVSGLDRSEQEFDNAVFNIRQLLK